MNGIILSPAAADSIRNWFNTNKGDYLEIGVYNGVFLSEVAKTYEDKKVFGIDPFISDGHTGQPRGEALTTPKDNTYQNISGLNNVTLWEATTQDCLNKKYYTKLSNVSCAFIDGSHHYNDIVVDIDFITSIQNKSEMYVVFDDLHIPDVINSIEYFKTKIGDRLTEAVNIINALGFKIKPSI